MGKDMRKEYDFSKAVRGKFYRANRAFRVVINVPGGGESSRYEVFSDSKGFYRFRLLSAGTVLFTSEAQYPSKDDCLQAIADLRHASVLAPTVFQ